MAEPLQAGDIVRIRGCYLGLVMHAWDSTMAPMSGRLVSIDYLGYRLHHEFGWHVGVLDSAMVEFMAKGVPPGVPIEELGMEHPWIMARFQAGVDASMARRAGISFCDALAIAEARAEYLFAGAPTAWVAMAVARTYADYGLTKASSNCNYCYGSL
jgi:hypothetical protein